MCAIGLGLRSFYVYFSCPKNRCVPQQKEEFITVTLEKVVRYEAHLSRQLYKAMHELEALQARRMGGSTPLARLDIDGAGD
jgi:hypothetical protein